MSNSPESNMPLLSVVIPAYNEAANLHRGNLQKTIDFLALKTYTSELIVVDDGSTDETASIIKELHPTVNLVTIPHQGKAASVTRGMLQSRGCYALFMDMDLATPLAHIDECLAKLEEGDDIVIGSRRLSGAQPQGYSACRRLTSWTFNALVKILLLPNIQDSQCGFKAFKHEAALQVFGNLKMFTSKVKISYPRLTAFDIELLLLGRKYKYRITEIQVNWHHVKSQRVALLPESLRMLQEVIGLWLTYRCNKSTPDS